MLLQYNCNVIVILLHSHWNAAATWFLHFDYPSYNTISDISFLLAHITDHNNLDDVCVHDDIILFVWSYHSIYSTVMWKMIEWRQTNTTVDTAKTERLRTTGERNVDSVSGTSEQDGCGCTRHSWMETSRLWSWSSSSSRVGSNVTPNTL